MKLVSHGWKKRCEVCERHSHAKWHEVALGELNPVALVQLIQSGQFTAADQIADYVIAVTGIDAAKMLELAELETRQAPVAVDPGRRSQHGMTTRVVTSSVYLPSPSQERP